MGVTFEGNYFGTTPDGTAAARRGWLASSPGDRST